LSADAISQARDVIKKNYGSKYLPDAPREYKSKVKNAQEAHEAIRPTDLSRTPDQVRGVVDEQMARLYELIWKRTMASQMENAVLDQVGADISDGTDDVVLRATGSTIAFDGFLTLYNESTDDDEEDEENRRLPPLNEGDKTKLIDVIPEQHFTQPPPRFTEASLVKRLEELGIGRPSTYASILQVLQDRKYVTLDKKRFFPEDRGRLVTAFLEKFFTKYVDYDFTANLEEELDAIAEGHVKWKEALRQFWSDFSKAVGGTKELTITQVIDHLNDVLGQHFFPPNADGTAPRLCPACHQGELSLKLGKFGAFVGCSRYPDCKYTRPLIMQDNGEGEQSPEDAAASAALANEPKILGEDPVTKKIVSMRRGPYGPYVQIDEPEGSKEKPKRQGVPKGVPLNDVTLESALKLLELPRDVGLHPQTGEMIKAGVGRFGPFLLHQKVYTSIPKGDDVLTIGMNRAVDLIAAKAERMAANPGKGRWGKKKTDDKAEDKAPVKVKAAAKKTAAKKTASKKNTVKKPVVKKVAVKKTPAKKSAK
jgi:DNA topoisomerase-1